MLKNIHLVEQTDDILHFVAEITGSRHPHPETGKPHVESHEHDFYVPLDAILNRKEFYGVTDHDDALHTILREFDAAHCDGGCKELPKKNKAGKEVKSWRDLTQQERGALTGGLDTRRDVDKHQLTADIRQRLDRRAHSR